MCAAVPYRATLTVARGRNRNRFVGRGILDASMAHSIRGRQGCRPLRPAEKMAPTVHPHRGRRRGPWPLAGGLRPLRRATGGAAHWTPRFWAARRSLARVVGEEFCVRPRCGFAAILDVWQEAGPQLWRKRPGGHRRHTDGGRPSQEKNRVKLLNGLWRRRLLIFGQEGERQNHFEQVAVHRQLHSAVLQLRQAPGNGQSQSIALTMARFIAPDKPFH